MGSCTSTGEVGVYGSDNLNNYTLEPAIANKKYYYCVKKYSGANTSKYYQVTLFYKFNLPVFGSLSGFTIRGTTSNFQAVDDDPRSPYCKTINENRSFCRT